MKRFVLMLLLIPAANAVVAQDYILKNFSDHFSIYKGTTGINIFGNNIIDTLGNYFLKTTDLSNLVHLTGNETINGNKTFGGLATFLDITTFSNYVALSGPQAHGLIFNSAYMTESPKAFLNAGSLVLSDAPAAYVPTARLMVASNTQGVLMPQMSQSDRTAINLVPSGYLAGASDGLQVYQLDGTKGEYINIVGSGWRRFLTTDDLPGGGGGTPADDATVVHLAGSETVTGEKTFTQNAYFGRSINFADYGAGGASFTISGLDGNPSINANKSGGTLIQLAFNATDGTWGYGLHNAEKRILTTDDLPAHGNSTTTGSATTAVTVTIGRTMADTNYFAGIAPQNALTAINWYISAKTTTTFTVTFTSGITGSIDFDWNVTP